MTILKLCKEIYSLHHIEQAIKMYEGLACIELSKEVNYWIAEFSACVYGEERTMQEFENYIIGLENE